MTMHPHYLCPFSFRLSRWLSGLSGTVTIATTTRRRSTSCYRSPKNVGIVPIIKAECELRQVERQIFLAHIVVSSDDPALEQRPKGIDALSVHVAAHVLANAVGYYLMRQRPFEVAIAEVFIGRDQFYFVEASTTTTCGCGPN